ncbi:MAG: FtsX-like permease family protein [Nitriliruptorales bacterium]|nr:FtsX-like permease family protein [Nitriliruptorales bacterium]
MLRVALKALLGHKLRFAMTALSVLLGVAFVTGSFVLTDSMDRAFTGLFEDIFEGTDVVVGGVNPTESFEGPPAIGAGPTLPEELREEIRGIDGVAEARGSVEGFAQFISKDDEPIGLQAPTFGFSWVGDSEQVTLRDGRAPTGPDDVTMDVSTAELNGFEVGDEVRIVLPSGVETFTIVGLTGFGDQDNLLGATVAAFDLARAQELFGKDGQLDTIEIVAADGVTPEELRDRVAAVIASDTVEVVTAQDEADEQLEQIRTGLGFFTTALLAFAGVALFVGSFIIANTFSIVVAQRTREFALLRALGASTRQVQWAVLIEALTVGVLAGTLGIFGGVALSLMLQVGLGAAGLDLPTGGITITARTIVASYAVAIVVTVVASIAPARRAARVAPVEAMRGLGTAREGSATIRTVVGAIAGAGGAAALVVGLLGPGGIALVGAGAALTMLGVALLAPLLATPVGHLLGELPARRGLPGRLAQRNATRNPVRTAATASALMIGLALVSFVSILVASVQGAVADTFDEQFRSDFIIATDQPGFRNLPPSVYADIDASPAIAAASPVRFVQTVDADDAATFVAGVNATAIADLVELGVTDGDIAALGIDEVFLANEWAADRDLAVGDSVSLTFADAQTVPLRVAGLFDNADLVSPVLVSLETATAHDPTAFDMFVFARAEGDLEAARQAITEIAGVIPGIEVQDQAEFRQSQEDGINQILTLMIGLLALAILIALLGIINTLALSVFERTREIGLLRAVGMDARQTRSMIRWESIIVAVFGALLGVVVGAFFGYAVVQALRDEGISRLVLPYSRLAIYVLAAGIGGVAAAIFPAWRASRLDVLEAVTTE